MNTRNWLDTIQWNDQGLIPVITQDATTLKVLMLAWINRAALEKTVQCGEAVYWSRSRNRLWHKGEESGHTQKIVDIRLDCDSDALLFLVEQTGLACHTGRLSCFYQRPQHTAEGTQWIAVDPVIKNPSEIYK